MTCYLLFSEQNVLTVNSVLILLLGNRTSKTLGSRDCKVECKKRLFHQTA